MRRESTEQFLIACLRTLMATEGEPETQILLSGEMDGEYLLRLAEWHRVVPLLYQSLNTACRGAVPEPVFKQIEGRYRENIRRNLLFAGELIRLLTLLDAHGIPVIPFKGPALASYLYGSLALRQFVDLDILVRRQDVLKVKGLLIAQGYQSFYRLNQAQEAALLQSGIEYIFYHEGLQIYMEIHWWADVNYLSIPLDLDRLWGRLERVAMGGSHVPHPSAEDMMVILCLHGSKHLWRRLSWICDVAQLLRTRRGIDFKRVMEWTILPPHRRMFLLGLSLAKDLLGAPMPEWVWQKVQNDSTTTGIAFRLKRELFDMPHGPQGIEETIFFQLKIRDRFRDKLGYCIQEIRILMTVPSFADYESIPLPESLFLLYYVVRPIRLTARYALGFMNRIYDWCKGGVCHVKTG